jgi:hypothetical protein
MPKFDWFEAFPSSGLTLAFITAMVRVLGGRPHLGLRKLQPIAVFELWVTRDAVRWLVGIDDQIARHLSGDLATQVRYRGRGGAIAQGLTRAAQLIGPAVSALSLAAGPHARLRDWWQSSRISGQLQRVQGKVRTWGGSVNAAELAVLLGYPVDGVHVPGRDTSFAAPPSALLLSPDDAAESDDRVIGTSLHARSKEMAVRVPARSIASRAHVIAPTGAGKSTLLTQWVLRDIEPGRSVFLIEPKGGLVTDILARLPRQHWPTVRLIEPGTPGPVLGFNPLNGPREDAERRADSLLNLFGKALGPRSTDVLLHALIMASQLDDGTLTDVPMLLTNSGFRRRVLATTTDPLTIAPWAARFDDLSELERSRVVMPILNKTRTLTAREPIRRLLGQPVPGVRLDGTVQRTVFPARHAGLRSGGMGTVSDDIGRHESTQK